MFTKLPQAKVFQFSFINKYQIICKDLFILVFRDRSRSQDHRSALRSAKNIGTQSNSKCINVAKDCLLQCKCLTNLFLKLPSADLSTSQTDRTQIKKEELISWQVSQRDGVTQTGLRAASTQQCPNDLWNKARWKDAKVLKNSLSCCPHGPDLLFSCTKVLSQCNICSC